MAAVTALLLTACAHRAKVADPAHVAASPDEGRTVVHSLWQTRGGGAAPRDPCLGPGDLLEISVFHFAEMQGQRARITPAGTINLPLIGTFQAAGLTENELREAIAARLREHIMRDPQITLFVAEHVSQQVSVTGAVARPGLYGLSRENRTVADLLSEAGGLNERAGDKVLFYPADGRPCATGEGAQPHVATARAMPASNPVEIDVQGQYEPPTENPLYLPVVGGDALVVNPGRFLVSGWVDKPGAYDIAPGMTAFGGISAAGGATFPANLSQVVVWRSRPGGNKMRIDVNVNDITDGRGKDVPLQAGDVIQVPASALKLVPYSGFWVLTNVVRVGAGVSLAGF